MSSELASIEAFCERIASPRLRSHFLESCARARALLLAEEQRAAAAAAPPPPLAPPGTALHRALSALAAAARLPAFRSPQLSPCAALVIAVHAFFLARGLVCTGCVATRGRPFFSLNGSNCVRALRPAPPFTPLSRAAARAYTRTQTHSHRAHDTPPGDAFAAPHRPVPAASFLPGGWDADGGDSFHLRFQRHGAGRMGAATLNVHAKGAEGGVLLLRAVADRSPHGGGRVEADARLPLALFADGYAAPAGSSPAAQLAALCEALGGAEASAKFEGELERGLLAPLLGEGSVAGPHGEFAGGGGGGLGGGGGGLGGLGGGGGGGGGGGAYPAGNPLAPGLPPPLTGRAPGAFDADLFPSFQGAVPGELGSAPFFGAAQPGGGGMQVGPDHPLFGGFGAPAGGALPPGALLPGARFDPFLPPALGGVGRGRLPGAGRGAPFPGEPDPDHAPVPGRGGGQWGGGAGFGPF